MHNSALKVADLVNFRFYGFLSKQVIVQFYTPSAHIGEFGDDLHSHSLDCCKPGLPNESLGWY